MTKMCKTCMAREADPSEYHDDACPVFQEQAAYRVGFDAGRRAGIEAAASAVARIANGVPRSIESVRLLTLTADAIRALAAPPPQGTPAAFPEAPAGCACTHEAGDSPCPIHGMDEPEPVKPTPALPMPKITRYASPEARTGGATLHERCVCGSTVLLDVDGLCQDCADRVERITTPKETTEEP